MIRPDVPPARCCSPEHARVLMRIRRLGRSTVGKYLTDGHTHCCCKLSNIDLLPGSSRSARASVAAPAERPCHVVSTENHPSHFRTRHAPRGTTPQQPVIRRAADGCLLMHQAQNRRRHRVAPACAQGDHKRNSKKELKAGKAGHELRAVYTSTMGWRSSALRSLMGGSSRLSPRLFRRSPRLSLILHCRPFRGRSPWSCAAGVLS